MITKVNIAGNMMLNTCPPTQSCGTNSPIWTDVELPTTVGLITNINAYAVVEGTCRAYALPLQVIRCSASSIHGVIYRYNGDKHQICSVGFCGMRML